MPTNSPTVSRSGTYQIRIDPKEKQETFAVFSDLGITPAQAIKMFFAQVRTSRSIPFTVEHRPNETSAKILLENKEYSKGFNTVEDLFADLES